MGDEFTQGMYRYLRDSLAGKAVGDVIGSKDSDLKQWATCAGAPCTGGSRTSTEIYTDEVKPAVAVLAVGTNPSGDLPANFDAHARELARIAGKHGAQVVLVGPFGNDPQGKRLAALRRVVPDAISGHTLAEGLPRDRDGLHLTQDGYKMMAERLAAAVFETLNKRQTPSRIDGRKPPTLLPGAGGQPLQPPVQPQPQALMASRQPVAAPMPKWVWGLVGVAGLSAVVLTVVLLKKRRAGAAVADYEEQSPLHERIAKALGWSVKDTQSFSLQALRELLRTVSPKLVHEIDQAIRSGEIVKGARYRRPRRYDY